MTNNRRCGLGSRLPVVVTIIGVLIAAAGCARNTNVDTYDEVRARLDSLKTVAVRGDEEATERFAVGLLTNLARQRDASTGERQEVYASLAAKMNDFSSAAFSEDAAGLEARIDEMRNLLPD